MVLLPFIVRREFRLVHWTRDNSSSLNCPWGKGITVSGQSIPGNAFLRRRAKRLFGSLIKEKDQDRKPHSTEP